MEQKVAASTQNQVLSARLFPYREVLHQKFGAVDAVRARKPKRLLTVLSNCGVLRIIAALAGLPQVIITLLCPSGSRPWLPV